MKRPIDGIADGPERIDLPPVEQPPAEPETPAAQAPVDAPALVQVHVAEVSAPTDAPEKPADASKLQRMRSSAKKTGNLATAASVEQAPQPASQAPLESVSAEGETQTLATSVSAAAQRHRLVGVVTYLHESGDVAQPPDDDNSETPADGEVVAEKAEPAAARIEVPAEEVPETAEPSTEQSDHPTDAQSIEHQVKRRPEDEDKTAGTETSDKASETKPVDASERHKDKPDIFVVFNQHMHGTGQIAAREFRRSGCGVVALEAPSLEDEQTRKHMEDAYTFMVSDAGRHGALAPDNPEAQRAKDSLGHNTFRAGVIAGLQGSNVTIKLLDINKNHPRYAEVAKMDNAAAVSEAATYDHAPNSKLRTLVIRQAQAIARTNEIREVTITEQIETLKQTFPDTTIGVGVGSGHNLILDKINPNHRTESIYIEAQGIIAQPEVLHLLRVSQRIQKGVPLDEELLNRTVLEASLLPPHDVAVKRSPLPLQSPTEYVDGLSDKKVAEKLKLLDSIKAGSRSHLEIDRKFLQFVSNEMKNKE